MKIELKDQLEEFIDDRNSSSIICNDETNRSRFLLEVPGIEPHFVQRIDFGSRKCNCVTVTFDIRALPALELYYRRPSTNKENVKLSFLDVSGCSLLTVRLMRAVVSDYQVGKLDYLEWNMACVTARFEYGWIEKC